MGESTNPRSTLRFDRRIRLEFHGATITSDAGLLACRELDDALGLTETACRRVGAVVTCSTDWWAFSGVGAYSRLAGYEDTNDAERLAGSDDGVSSLERRGIDRPAPASTNTMSRFETEVLTQDGNVEGLGRLNAKWVDGAMSRTPHRLRVTLGHGQFGEPGTWRTGGSVVQRSLWGTCYHPLFVFNQFGDCEGANGERT